MTMNIRKAIVFTVLLLAGMVQSVAQTVTKRGVVYTLVGDHYEATAFDASNAEAENWDSKIVVADYIDDKPVTAVAANAFDATIYNKCATATSVELGSQIKTIGDYAFYLCKLIKEVSFNEGLTSIGDNAFHSCNALGKAVLPASLTTIGTAAFYNCRFLVQLTITSGGLNIGTSAFGACPSLRTIRFLSTAPTLGLTAFNNVGTVSNPTYVYVPYEYFPSYVQMMTGVGDNYGWISAGGNMSLRTAYEGLYYAYVAPPSSGSVATMRIAAVDEQSMVNKGSSSSPAYLLQVPENIYGFRVNDIIDGAFMSTKADSIFAIDLRQTGVTGFTVNRTTGTFAGVSLRTMIYLPADNATSEKNVVIGGQAPVGLQVGRPVIAMSSEEIANGRATWLMNDWFKSPVFGQQIGSDATPVPMRDATTQRVWQASFMGVSKQYRYANTGKTVTLPSAAEMGFDAAQPVSFYIADDAARRFTASTVLSEDIIVHTCPSTESVILDHAAVSLKMSTPIEARKVQLVATAAPSDGRQEVIWTSSNPDVATVNVDGVVVGVSAGQTVITAVSIDNPSAKTSCTVTVIPTVERVELSETEITIPLSAVADPVFQLSAVVYPAEAIQDVVWQSQNTEICTVDENGLIRGIAAGRTAVEAIPKDRASLISICYVTVLPAADSVWINRNSYNMLPGDQEVLRAKVKPSTAVQTIRWDSSDATVATVSDAGVVTALKQGQTTITATSVARPDLSAQCVITVAGVGTRTEIEGVTYEITQLDTDAKTVQILHLSDSLLNQGGEHSVTEVISFARLDFKVTEVADTAFGQLTNNTLYYIPATIDYKGEADNVVVAKNSGATCKRLVITEGFDFVTSHTFTAAEVVCQRTCPVQKAFTIALPISVTSGDKVRLYDMKQQEGDSLVCVEVQKTEPYKPYVALAEVEQLELGGTNIEVTPYLRNTDVYVGDVQFMGTMRRIDVSSLSVSAYVLNNRDWQVTSDTEIEPMTAWLATTHSPLHVKLVDGDKTAIHSIQSDVQDVSRVYDLQGRPVSDVSNLPKGIYIRNGRKFVKK